MRALAFALAVRADPGFTLEWRSELACDASRFERSLATQLAQSRRPNSVAVVATVERPAPTQWTIALELVTADARSTRHLAGATCEAVSEAAAFVTAIVIDPGFLLSPAPPAPPMDEEPVAPAPGPPAPAAPPLAAAPSPAPAPAPVVPATPRRRRPGGFVRLGGGLEGFGLPGVGPTANLAGGLLGRAWRAELSAAYRAPTSVAAVAMPEVSARVRMWAVGARGCGVAVRGSLELQLCAGAEAGAVIGEGRGFPGGLRAARPWLALGLGPALAWVPRRWLAVALGLEMGLPLQRGEFIVDGLGTLYTIPAVSLRATLGVEARIF